MRSAAIVEVNESGQLGPPLGCVSERFGVGPEGVFYTTGPVAYTEAIVPLLKSANYHLERTNYKMGFIFNALGPQYRKLVYESRPHYSALDEPVVLPG